MSCTTSSDIGKPYGIKRVCWIWGQPRSSFYSARLGCQLERDRIPAGKRGPKALIDARFGANRPGNSDEAGHPIRLKPAGQFG